MASFLAFTASVLSLGGSALYNLDLFRGRIKPNLSTWLIWTFITILNSSSYFAVSADGIKSLLAFSNSAATIITFGVIMWRGNFSRVTPTDIVAAIIGILAGIVWIATKSATSGNVVIQLAIVVGCLPTYRSGLARCFKRTPLAVALMGRELCVSCCCGGASLDGASFRTYLSALRHTDIRRNRHPVF